MTIESCVENIEQAIQAAQNGADQLEFCADLDNDGLTPTDTYIQEVLTKVDIPVKVMIRCRSGNFCYTEAEIVKMEQDIIRISRFPIDGFVLGALQQTDDKIILDIEAIRGLCKAAYPFKVTIHKAIDLCTDIPEEIPKLKTINNIRFILSSGGKPTATQGKEMLRIMQNIASPEIEVIAAGKITHQNLQDLHSYLNLSYYHGKNITDMSF